MSDEGESRHGNEGGGAPPPYGRRCYKCGEGGHLIRDCAKFWRARAQGRPFVPLAPPATQTRTRRTTTTGTENVNFRRSRSADSGSERSGENTDALMREYFVHMVEEQRERIEREKEAERRRAGEEAQHEKEARRAAREEQRLRMEEERDARLMRIIRREMKKDKEEDEECYELKGKRQVKMASRVETANDEKERLRKWIAQRTIGKEESEDEELMALRRQAAKLELMEKRKQGPDVPIRNSPPMTTPEKRTSKGIFEEAKTHIESMRGDLMKDIMTSSTPSKVDLSLKHIMATCGPGGKKKFEQDCQEFYDTLTIDELKEACRREKVAYGNRELAIKRLVIRRSAVAYDPSNIPLPTTPHVTTRSSKGVTIKEERKPDTSESDQSFSEDDSE
ncbi:hypothetical protein CBR_g24049 [Chara braunii]|uniref:CCHC-type domain-containing protein n=1 Tax=Chara braunii TaxID=69332 RepID=A0A388L5T4_CHABU|nr:hypothetical protein CBR_g24049 [Chara braunii]|eukprot:GBG77602.1 hypothetical protein CBR_g24049 [Chara braunii]